MNILECHLIKHSKTASKVISMVRPELKTIISKGTNEHATNRSNLSKVWKIASDQVAFGFGSSFGGLS